MKIKEVKISNWRSIKNLTISFQDLMIFIGQNNSGKSNILSAILFFFDKIKDEINSDDFNFYSKDLYVEIVFSLEGIDKNKFENKNLIIANTITIRRTIKFENNPYYEVYGDNCVENLQTLDKQIFGEVYFLPAFKDTPASFNRIFNAFSGKDKYKNDLDRLIAEFESEIDILGIKAKIKCSEENSKIEVIIDDGCKTKLDRKGHGLQRYLQFFLITNILLLVGDKEDSIKYPIHFYIIDEPELYLHPQAQRRFFDSLVKLSSSSSNQIILCTHSSSFIHLDKYKSICIVRKNNQEEGTKIFQCEDEILIDNKKQDFNLKYYINPDRSELFFAKKVILVEGRTEKIVIPFLANTLGVFNHDFTIIDCDSKTEIPLYIKLLNKFSIPYVAVYDKDYQIDKKRDDKGNIKNSDDQTEKITKEIGDSSKNQVVFDNDIEEEISKNNSSIIVGDKGKALAALEYIQNFNNYEPPPSLKEKIRKIYEDV